ncbi:hypothetical protein [Herbiconiux solani]|uniref:hypothetical protein n=1 Tax=Herbiconiux solani TaxID=661329 RepID=UPI0008245554|nr:hypothetical protein [Herbiconiux solani]
MTDQPPADRDASVDSSSSAEASAPESGDQAGSQDQTERQPGTDGPNLGSDGTIPNSDTGIAVGHDPDGSHFNPEEDPDPAPEAD